MDRLFDKLKTWAEQFSGAGLSVQSDADCYNEDIGPHSEIKVSPNDLNRAEIRVTILGGHIGLDIERWSRLSKRLAPLIGSLDRATRRGVDYVGAFSEPGLMEMTTAVSVLDSIATGQLTIKARHFGGRLSGTNATIRVGDQRRKLPGPSTNIDSLRILGWGRVEVLEFAPWSTDAILLSELLVRR
jgi:hypothetical protein